MAATCRRGCRPFLCALALLCFGAPAAADPIYVVTGGSAGITLDDDTGFRLSGPDFVIEGEAFGSGGALSRCVPCVPGTTFNLSTVATVEHFPFDTPTFDGRAYGDTWYDGTLTFQAGSVTVPNVPPDGSAELSVPFSFVGRITAFDNMERLGPPLFSAEFRGSGTAVARMFSHETVGIFGGGISYNFEEAAPVPEPGTLLLLGSGIAAALARRRRALYRN